MAHTLAVPSSRWSSYSSPAQSFQDLPTALHRLIASYLYASEALAVGATEQAMEEIYPASSIIDIPIKPRMLDTHIDSIYLGSREWEAYLVKHGASLSRLLTRLPCLKVLTVYSVQENVVYQAILFQPCRHLASINLKYGTPPGFHKDEIPLGPCEGTPLVLHRALKKGHLPAWSTLVVFNNKEAVIAPEALRAGHLTRVKALEVIWCDAEMAELRSLLEAFRVHEGKLEALDLEIHRTSDLVTRDIMHEFLSSPVCSNLRKLQLSPCGFDSSSSAMVFMSYYLRNGGAVGRHSLRELHFACFDNEDASCLIDALLLGGGREMAPTLEEIHFEYAWNEDILAQLGPSFFARGALANITTLLFHNLGFDNASMSSLMDGFRQSGHGGRTLKKLVFDWCVRMMTSELLKMRLSVACSCQMLGKSPFL